MKTGNSIKGWIGRTSQISFFLIGSIWADFSLAQTGNNWKIIVNNPSSDPYWHSVGKTRSSTPKFNEMSPEPGTYGSCVVIEPDLVLTVAHAIRNTKLDITIAGNVYEGNLMAIDLYNDRALLRLKNNYMGPVRKLRKEPLKENEKLKCYGFGTKYGYHNVEFKNNLFFGDAYFGDSGGPIFDESGEVVGVVCSTSKDDVAKQTNIFSYGHESLYKWVNDNKTSVVDSPKLTVSK